MDEVILKIAARLKQLNYTKNNKLNCENQKLVLSYTDIDGWIDSGVVIAIWVGPYGYIDADLRLEDGTTTEQMIGVTIVFDLENISNLEKFILGLLG